MSLWITLRRTPLALLVLAVVALGLAACGSKSSIESGKTDDEVVAQTKPSDVDDTVRLKGEDEASGSFEARKAKADAARAAKVAALPSGSTRSGAGKLTEVAVRTGDTLWKVSERADVYGSGWLYPLILQANKDRIPDPDHLVTGVVLRVPRDIPDPQVEMAKEQAMTGELLDRSAMVGAQPAATAVPAPLEAAPVPAKAEAKGHGSVWLWILLVAAAVGAFLWWRRRSADDAA